MTEQKGQHNEQYQEARRKFDDLRIEDKAVFLLESTVTTFARGLEEMGRAVAESLEKSFDEAERRREERDERRRQTSTPPESGPENGASSTDVP